MPSTFYSSKSPVLLTGAGFSKPFGGYLATEMWSIILSQPHIAESEPLRRLLLDDLNFERVYDKVLSSTDLQSTEKTDFTLALQNAYSELDEAIRSNFLNKRQCAQSLRHFLGRFAGTGRNRGFIFTLNQDLLVERLYSNQGGLLQIPALGHPDWFTGKFEEKTPPEIKMPEPRRIAFFRENFWEKGSGLQNFLYIKLHGSYAWKSANNSDAFVIGHEKSGSIAKEPLLQWYLQLFKEVLNLPNQILVVVGYGFMDRHINEIIADAAETGLKLYVISPLQPRELRQVLDPLHSAGHEAAHRGKEIWRMLRGYYCSSVDMMIPTNASVLPGLTQAFFKQTNLE